MALPQRLLTDVRNNAALRTHFHRGGFAGAGPRGVQVEPEAESAPSSRGMACGAARLEGVPARLAERRAHHPGKVAAIPDLAVRRAVGHLPEGDEIAFAQCHAIDSGLPCGCIHQPLHHVHTLRLPRAAKRVDRSGMGVRRAHRQVEDGNAVEVGEGASKPDDGRCGRHRGRVRAHVAVGHAAQRQDSPLLVEGKLGDAVVAPRVGVGERSLGAGRHPAHRRAEHARRDQHGALLRVVHELHSEAAAHVRRDHTKPVLVDSQTRRDEGAHDVHALALRVEAVRIVDRVVASDRGSGFDRGGPHPVVGAFDPDHVGGPRECEIRRFRVTDPSHYRDFVAFPGVKHHGHRFVLDLDPLRRVGGGIDRRRHDHCHRIADEA